MKTIDDKATEYVKSTKLEKETYIGDVETGYVCGYLQAESDLICKLYETRQFTLSKIAEILGKRLMEVRNAVNQREWK